MGDQTQTMQGQTAETPPVKQRRGFALMSPEQRSAISRKGGQTAHAKGTAHQYTPEEAREAGRKGGQASSLRRKKTSA